MIDGSKVRRNELYVQKLSATELAGPRVFPQVLTCGSCRTGTSSLRCAPISVGWVRSRMNR